jgi:hypothetical protein
VRGEGEEVPKGWESHSLGGWAVAAHSLLPLTEIRDTDHELIGWLIGHALIEGSIVRGVWKLPIRITSERDVQTFEESLYRFGGRWACVLIASNVQRVYLDPSGSLAAVYRTDAKIVGSTPTLVHFDSIDVYRAKKSAETPLPANHFWPAGLTGDDDTRRIVPNHYLDLTTWKTHRHWPLEPIERVPEALAAEKAKAVTGRLRCNIKAISSEFDIYMGLSAGRDSRMIMGAAKSVIDKFTFVTFNYKDPAKFADLHIATKLAKKFRLKHESLDLLDPPREQKLEYLDRVGYCNNAGKACDFYDACGRLLDMKRAWLTGYGGEVGRAFYWKPDDAGKRLTADDLLSRMHLNLDDRNLFAMKQWLGEMPDHLDAHAILDQMYIELRLGCWASPQQYGTAPFAAILTPFTHRLTYQSMLEMPLEYRARQGMTDDVIKQTWPEALALPFQQYSGMMGFAGRMRETYKKLKKKVRSKLGLLKPPVVVPTVARNTDTGR